VEHLVLIIGSALGGLLALNLLSRLCLWWRYGPTPPLEDDALPSVTVLIPAFNEGSGVRRAIESVLESTYPAHLLTLTVIDDGSTDDTWRHIHEAVNADSRARAVRLSANAGKRHALFRGLSEATSELVVTVDSDSRVEPDALRHLVAPFANSTVGAVAGRILVDNREVNLLTRMLAARFILGFDLVRAYQSELDTVWCCPGALQAYRLATIEPHLKDWRDQRFLGADCTNGDDHALTNQVLSLGHAVRYQSTAVAHTRVPETYLPLTRMLTRWGRSATREGLRALAFAPRRARNLGAIRGPLMMIDALCHPLVILLKLLALPASAIYLAYEPLLLLSGLALTLGAGGLYTLIYLRSDPSLRALYALAWAAYATLALPWVQPWATLTVRSNRWMTRSKDTKSWLTPYVDSHRTRSPLLRGGAVR
jgi:hyaluronan synthase